ncbi:hypothetical protein Ancab_012825 [Ancistrocladus abbreviatus]
MEYVQSETACYYRIEGCPANDMPDWVLHEIFLRLPVKSLFRFKCVSKHWHSLISDPSFARSYTCQNIDKNKCSLCWTFLFCYMNSNCGQIPPGQMGLGAAFKLCHPNYNKLPSFALQFLKRKQRPTESVRVLASSNGLLLCCASQHWQELYYVCNPLTIQWVALPRRPQLHKWVSIGFLVEPEDGAFQVVRIAEFSSSSNVLDLEIFFSKDGKWIERKLLCACPVWLSIAHRQAVPYQGILHWREYNNRIIAYDPKSNIQTCRLLDMPKDRDRDGQGILGVSQDSLRYFEVHRWSQNRGLSVWVLKNYEIGEWCLEYRVSIAEIYLANPQVNKALQSSRCLLCPLAFHPLNPNIVYLVCNNNLALYDLETRRLETVRFDCFPLSYLDLGTVFPFVLQPWPTPVHKPWIRRQPG